MPATENPAATRRGRSVPLLISLGLLAVLGLAVYWLYHSNLSAEQKELSQKLSAATEKAATLEAERKRLTELLALEPCAARQALDPAQARPGGRASNPAAAPATGSTTGPAAGAAAGPAAESTQGSPAPSATPEKVPAAPAPGKEGSQPVASQTPQAGNSTVQAAQSDAVSLLEKACVFILSLDGKGNLSTGSGFFVAPGYVATNNHVVPGQGKVLITSKALGRPVAGRVIARERSGGRDYALIRADVPGNAAIAVPSFAGGVRRTEKVGAWGFPHVIGQNDPAYRKLLSGRDISAVPELAYSEGVVSAILERVPPLVVHTAPISPGNSGGPLVNAQGQIVGINTMITLDEDSYRQASIALTGSDLQHFLRQQGIAITPAP